MQEGWHTPANDMTGLERGERGGHGGLVEGDNTTLHCDYRPQQIRSLKDFVSTPLPPGPPMLQGRAGVFC